MRTLGFGLTLLLLGAAIGVGRHLDARHERARVQGQELVYLPPTVLLKYGTMGHRTVAADWIWLQALQYYGEEWNRRHRYRDLHRYIDLVNELDPDFDYAYRFGAAAVPYNTGRWTWHNVDASTRIAERGLERFPDDWRLWLQIGFNKGVIGTDFEGAAEAYRRAAAVPGSPKWIPQLVTRLYATAGALDRARAYALQLMEAADQPELREAMQTRLLEIAVEEALVKIDEAIAKYRDARGVAPPSIYALVAGGFLLVPPEEAMGGAFYIEDGEARSTSLHKGRLRVFDEAENVAKAVTP